MIPLSKINIVYQVFEKNYIFVPLEIFGEDPYETLISTIMSARTNDDTTLEAAKRLFKKAPDIYSLQQLSTESVEQLIYPVGFYKTKAKHLKLCADKIIDKYNGKIPNTREELLNLPGVGRKTANLVLNRAFGKPAIAVDTHVHRITNLLGWVNTNKPEETEKELTKKIPEKYWSEMNRLFVSIGRQYTSKKKLEDFLRDNELL